MIPKEPQIYRLLRKADYSWPVKHERPTSDEVFMNMALEVSRRSPDAQTGVGAVIVKDNRILSTGYNGFPRDIDYSSLPNTRPDKYPWMMHAERNALAWCEKRPVGCSIYCSMKCCNQCLLTLWQHGLVEVIELNQITALDKDECDLQRSIFLELSGMIVRKMDILR